MCTDETAQQRQRTFVAPSESYLPGISTPAGDALLDQLFYTTVDECADLACRPVLLDRVADDVRATRKLVDWACWITGLRSCWGYRRPSTPRHAPTARRTSWSGGAPWGGRGASDDEHPPLTSKTLDHLRGVRRATRGARGRRRGGEDRLLPSGRLLPARRPVPQLSAGLRRCVPRVRRRAAPSSSRHCCRPGRRASGVVDRLPLPVTSPPPPRPSAQGTT